MRGMVDAAEPSANLPDDVGVLKSIIGEKTALLREQELRIAVLEEELRLAHHKRWPRRRMPTLPPTGRLRS